MSDSVNQHCLRNDLLASTLCHFQRQVCVLLFGPTWVDPRPILFDLAT